MKPTRPPPKMNPDEGQHCQQVRRIWIEGMKLTEAEGVDLDEAKGLPDGLEDRGE